MVTAQNHLVGDGGKPLATFARNARIPFHAVPSPGKPTPEAPHLHISNVNAYHSRLKQWLNRFNGVATKILPSYLGWRSALEAWGQRLDPPNCSQARSETDSINDNRKGNVEKRLSLSATGRLVGATSIIFRHRGLSSIP